MTPKKRLYGYLISCAFLILTFIGYFFSCNIKSNEYSFDGVFSFIYLLFVTPLASAFYGVISYMLTKRVIIPNIVLFVLSALIMMIGVFFNLNSYSKLLDELWGVFPLSIIMFVISIVCSFATMFIVRQFQKRQWFSKGQK